jgi:hypothetical protein
VLPARSPPQGELSFDAGGEAVDLLPKNWTILN